MACLAGLAACTAAPSPSTAPDEPTGDLPSWTAASAAHAPPFANRRFEVFARANVLAIVLREWRSFGQNVNDEPPDRRVQKLPDEMADHQPGMWQRVGEYWWLGQDADSSAGSWTAKYDGNGRPIAAGQEDAYAWSAAFVSYVMRSAGAGSRFPYAIAHATYINQAARVTPDRANDLVLQAERPESYAPQPGDLICHSRTLRPVRFDDLPRGRFPAHCDFVIDREGGNLRVIGGNVDHSVTMKHVPVTAEGMLATTDGVPVDGRYPWFVVLRVRYDG